MFETFLNKAEVDAVDALLKKAADIARRELEGQGHKLTGSLIASIETKLQVKRNAILGLVLMNDYFEHLEYPLPPERVPYGSGSGAKQSKLIRALTNYWKKRGLGNDEAKRASFATANKWKQEGRPTKASFRFSKNGRRTGFLAESLRQIEKQADEVLSLKAEDEISKALTIAIQKAI